LWTVKGFTNSRKELEQKEQNTVVEQAHREKRKVMLVKTAEDMTNRLV